MTRTKLMTLTTAAIMFALLSIAPQDVTATTLTFQQGVSGYSGTLDTYVRQDASSTNNGGETSMQAISITNKGRKSLIMFDDIFGAGAGQVPAGGTITSATLRLTSPEVVVGSTVNVDPLLVDIPEYGTSMGVFEVGAVSWSHKVFATTDWGSPGNGPTIAGGEYDGTETVSVTPPVSAVDQDIDFDITSIVQQWYAQTLTNNGLVLSGDSNLTTNVQFRQSGFATLADRPELIIEFQPVPEPATIWLLLGGLAWMGLRRRNRVSRTDA